MARSFLRPNLADQAGVSAAGSVLRNANFHPKDREGCLMRPGTLGVALEYRFD
jgi:hypothetical protein